MDVLLQASTRLNGICEMLILLSYHADSGSKKRSGGVPTVYIAEILQYTRLKGCVRFIILLKYSRTYESDMEKLCSLKFIF